MRRHAAREQAVVLQAAAMLLQYPDDRLYAQLPVLAAAVSDLPPGPPGIRLSTFVEYVAASPPGDLQRHYVEVFDQRRAL